MTDDIATWSLFHSAVVFGPLVYSGVASIKALKTPLSVQSIQQWGWDTKSVFTALALLVIATIVYHIYTAFHRLAHAKVRHIDVHRATLRHDRLPGCVEEARSYRLAGLLYMTWFAVTLLMFVGVVVVASLSGDDAFVLAKLHVHHAHLFGLLAFFACFETVASRVALVVCLAGFIQGIAVYGPPEKLFD